MLKHIIDALVGKNGLITVGWGVDDMLARKQIKWNAWHLPLERSGYDGTASVLDIPKPETLSFRGCGKILGFNSKMCYPDLAWELAFAIQLIIIAFFYESRRRRHRIHGFWKWISVPFFSGSFSCTTNNSVQLAVHHFSAVQIKSSFSGKFCGWTDDNRISFMEHTGMQCIEVVPARVCTVAAHLDGSALLFPRWLSPTRWYNYSSDRNVNISKAVLHHGCAHKYKAIDTETHSLDPLEGV